MPYTPGTQTVGKPILRGLEGRIPPNEIRIQARFAGRVTHRGNVPCGKDRRGRTFSTRCPEWKIRGFFWWSQQDPNLCPIDVNDALYPWGQMNQRLMKVADGACSPASAVEINLDCLTCVAVRSAAAQTVHFWKSPDRPCICEYRYERLWVSRRRSW